MPDKITFYAVVGGDRTIDNPYGLVRRLEFDGDGFTDEGLRKVSAGHSLRPSLNGSTATSCMS